MPVRKGRSDPIVLGRFGDELDVEHIQIWELVKPEG